MGNYRMDGRVTTCTLETLHTLRSKAQPIMDSLPGHKICIPPIPRYLKTPCCDIEGHCDCITKQDHAVDLMSKSLAIRRKLKEYMIQKGTYTLCVGTGHAQNAFSDSINNCYTDRPDYHRYSC
jgi:hypothetical protein